MRVESAQTERGKSCGDATKKRGFHALLDSEIYTSEYSVDRVDVAEEMEKRAKWATMASAAHSAHFQCDIHPFL